MTASLKLQSRFVVIFISLLIFNDLVAQSEQTVRIADFFRVNQSKDYVPDIIGGSGVAFRDLNADGLPDIYLTCLEGNNHLLVNSGAYRPFKDVTQIAALSGNLRPEGVYHFESGRTVHDRKNGAIIVDIENDGDGDVILTGWGISTAVYRNNGQLQFENITEYVEIFPPIYANGCFSADIDNDRFPDLFITDEHQSNRMLQNTGDGSFIDITKYSGLQSTGPSRGASFSDVDRDGDLDLYICRYKLPDLFYRNIGDGQFKRILLPLPTLTDSLKSISVTFADIDNDADFDMLVTQSGGRNYLYKNHTVAGNSLWVFVETKFDTMDNNAEVSMGSVITDFNNDGFQDIYITNTGPNSLYVNNKDGTFIKIRDVDETKINITSDQSKGVACADFDLDGDIDIFIANKNTSSQFYRNILDNDNYIKIKLIGIRSNMDAIGSCIEIYRAGFLGEKENLLGSREISAGSGYYSLNEPLIHFGLDTVKSIDARIYFPSGKVLEEKNLTAGNSYTFYEYPLVSRAFIQSGQHINFLMGQPSFWYQVLLTLLFFALIFLFVRLGSRRYKWSAGTASGYLIGFFLLALISITALKKLGLIYILSIIDLLTIVFVAIFFVNSERLYRLRLIRERYRMVLINLSNQIVNIHDDQKLYQTVINNISQNTEFDKVAIIPMDHKKKVFIQPASQGLSISSDELNSLSNRSDLILSLLKNNHLQYSDLKEFQPYFELLSSVILISIERNENLLGILSIGTDKDISPLTAEDIELFESLGNQMAIAIENNEYINRSTEMIKKLTEAKVREKYLKELEATNAVLDSKNQDLQKLYDELKNTQAQLIHSEKMASLGQLVAGISHELNNPIGFIYANVKQLKSYTDKIEKFTHSLDPKFTTSEEAKNLKIESILPDLKNLIDDTIHGSQMVKNLVDNLRKFSHLDQAQWKEVDIHQGIESSLMILNPELKHRIKVKKDFKANRLIECNPGQINQVFLNLLSNAAQAIEGEGTITIKTEEDDNNLYVHISDSGSGIPAKILSKIFDPFFTTKDVGKGTGLGLSISYSIIKNHNGSIEVESKVDKGSTFTLILPFLGKKTDLN
ncbi:MAG: VCBS repeat-containing protein [Calditrichia bacterium]|nr:VCBS repeat-containing protein [Calditrichia bacterium]